MNNPKAQRDSHLACYCGSETAFEICCGPCIEGARPAQTAEQLMRSRYSAFVLRDDSYLLSTWHPQSRPSRVRFDDDLCWLGLRIKACVAGGEGDEKGLVRRLRPERKGDQPREDRAADDPAAHHARAP